MKKILFSFTSLIVGVLFCITSVSVYGMESEDETLKTSTNKLYKNFNAKAAEIKTAPVMPKKLADFVSYSRLSDDNSSTAKILASNYVASGTISRGGSSELNEKTVSPVELLDWWKDARYVFPNDSIAEVTDISTGKSFTVVRTMGSNHADAEALNKEDSIAIKSVWGGFSWSRRPVIVTINGRRLAASMSAMPHAGLDSKPAYAYVKNRSQGYGSGQNLDVIKDNGMDGHFDIHFLNSTRHLDGKKDPDHQQAIAIAANSK